MDNILLDIHVIYYFVPLQTVMRGDKKVAKISFTNIHIFNTGDYTCQAKNGAMDSDGQVIVVKKTVKLYVRCKLFYYIFYNI